MARIPLRDRREQVTETITWSLGEMSARVIVSGGVDQHGKIKEVWIRGAGKSGSERDFLLDDIAVVVARDLQNGDDLVELAAGVGRTSEGEPTSLLGAVLDTLVKMQADLDQVEAPPRRVPAVVFPFVGATEAAAD